MPEPRYLFGGERRHPLGISFKGIIGRVALWRQNYALSPIVNPELVRVPSSSNLFTTQPALVKAMLILV